MMASTIFFLLLLPTIILLLSSISQIKSTNPLLNCTLSPEIHLQNDVVSIASASVDHGNLVHQHPRAVLHPSSVHVISKLIQASNNCSRPFGVAARGRGHSVRGQSMARGGVVVDMPSLGAGIRVSTSGYYADAGGDQLWIDVLRAGLEYGLAPVSWTDYLYLTVGGTLSNAGISGQSFLHGPQISNVLELDVITGKGEFITCSKNRNSELFYAVLGGLGQFGIITRARIVLQKAPTRAKWMRLIYTDFSMFTRDQERLISSHMINGPNYVEGSIITENTPPNNWRSSFYSPSQLSKIANLMKTNQGILYSIELVKYYDDQSVTTVDHEVEMILKDMNFNDGFIFEKDVSFFDFLHRVGGAHAVDPSEEAHPWMNLFLPKSRIVDFNEGVFVDIILRQNKTSGPILFYPFNKQKWDDRMSAVIPEREDIFYTVGLLHTSSTTQFATVFDDLNKQILQFCENKGIKVKQYLPHYESKEDWKKHFGSKWDTFQLRKTMFDPRMILSPGQRIFSDVTSVYQI